MPNIFHKSAEIEITAGLLDALGLAFAAAALARLASEPDTVNTAPVQLWRENAESEYTLPWFRT